MLTGARRAQVIVEDRIEDVAAAKAVDPVIALIMMRAEIVVLR